MFAQEEAYGDYIDRFFAKHPYPSISWIHDLEKQRYGAAAEALLSDAHDAEELATKEVGLSMTLSQGDNSVDGSVQLMLSIGKLSQLAHLQENEGTEDETMLDCV